MTRDIVSVLKGKYPAKAHAKRVVQWMKTRNPNVSGILYLEAQKTRMKEDNDEEAPFRQRRYFYYLTGCPLPDAYLTYDISTSKSTLFIPPIDPESVIWSGLPLSTGEALELYDVDEVKTTKEVGAFLSRTVDKPIWAIEGQTPKPTVFTFNFTDLSLLKLAIEECRVVKDDYEIALTIKANQISTIAHTAVLKAVKTAKNERELEGLFLGECVKNGAREQAYHGIFASGEAAATLHYVKNYETLEGKLNLLVDAGGEYGCYASDIVSPSSPLTFIHLSLVARQGTILMNTDTRDAHLWQVLPRIALNLRYRPKDATRLHRHA